MLSFTPLLVFGVAALAAARQSAPAVPNFTGRWRANFRKSTLQVPLPESTVFTIEHTEPNLGLSRTHTSEGKSDTWSIRLTTDGGEVVQRTGEREVRCRAYWDGKTLVFEARLPACDGGDGHDLVRYQMAEDGNSFTAFESYRSPTQNYDNVWLLERIQPE